MKTGFQNLGPRTTKTCDHTDYGHSTNKGDVARCGKKATWHSKGTCGCGACDMSYSLCDQHYAAEMDHELAELVRIMILDNLKVMPDLVKGGWFAGKMSLSSDKQTNIMRPHFLAKGKTIGEAIEAAAELASLDVCEFCGKDHDMDGRPCDEAYINLKPNRKQRSRK